MTTRFDESNDKGKGGPGSTGLFEGQPDFDAFTLDPGSFVDERFRMQATLPIDSGEADLFICIDEQTGEQAILKFYRYKFQPKSQVINHLLNLHHKDLVRVLKYGTWAGRFYEAMEYCSGGMLSSYLPLGLADIRRILPEIVNGLQYLHDQNIVHRDIKPDNFYFRQPDMQDLVIGDFGISSLIEPGEISHKTKKSAWSAAYTAPETFDNTIHKKSDYYSLGITLIHVFKGASPFAGFETSAAIVAAHYRGDIPHVESLPDDLRTLVKGLTQFKPNNRWGCRQIMQWLNGTQILTDEGRPWRADSYAGKENPYPNYQKAKTPKELASALDKFDSKNDLFRGRISNWVFNAFGDATLTKEIEKIEENYTNNRDLGLLKLKYLLDPEIPLELGTETVTTIEELASALQSIDPLTVKACEETFWGQEIECWLYVHDEIIDKENLLKKIEEIRERLKNKPRMLGVFSLLYTISPKAPLFLTKNKSIKKIDDIENIIKSDHKNIQAIQDNIFNEKIYEWLKAVFPDRKKDYEFVSDVIAKYKDDQEMGTYVFRWYFNPAVSFPFMETEASNPKELASLIDRSESSIKKGIELLKNGWIKTWLETTGRMPDIGQFDSVINSKSSWESKIEIILHLLDPNLSSPRIEVDKPRLELGKIPAEEQRSTTVTIKNTGRGHLSGIVSLSGQNHGISIDAEDRIFEGKEKTIKINIRTSTHQIGANVKALMSLESNGGKLEIPIDYRVPRKYNKYLFFIMLLAIIFGTYKYYSITQKSGENNKKEVAIETIVNPKGNKADFKKIYQKIIHRTDDAVAFSVDEWSDGGFIIAGTYNRYTKPCTFLIRTDIEGNVIWEKNYGTKNGGEVVKSILALPKENASILLGYKYTGQIDGLYGFLRKLNRHGDIIWEKTYGDGLEPFYSFKVTPDNGYIIAGSKNHPGKIAGDVQLIRTDENGNVIWKNTYLSGRFTTIESIEIDLDNGFILAGYFPENDAFSIVLFKVDSQGKYIWGKSFRNSGEQKATSVKVFPDGGYVLAGLFSPSPGESDGNNSSLLLRTNTEGDRLWDKTYYNPADDTPGESAVSVNVKKDGGLLVLARSSSINDKGPIILFETDKNGIIVWRKELGWHGATAEAVKILSSGGLVVVGSAWSSEAKNEILLIKTDSKGNVSE